MPTVHLLNSPGKQGLLHISEVSWKRLETMEGVMNEGDMVKELIGLDPKTESLSQPQGVDA
jgi:ribosomal protein S1